MKLLKSIFLDGDGENLSACRVLAAAAMILAGVALYLGRDAATIAALVGGGVVPLVVRTK